jgi:hypothetical protein
MPGRLVIPGKGANGRGRRTQGGIQAKARRLAGRVRVHQATDQERKLYGIKPQD